MQIKPELETARMLQRIGGMRIVVIQHSLSESSQRLQQQ
jgi:hypothetical protein